MATDPLQVAGGEVFARIVCHGSIPRIAWIFLERFGGLAVVVGFIHSIIMYF